MGKKSRTETTILELLDEWWEEIQRVYIDRIAIKVSNKDRERIEAIDIALGKKLARRFKVSRRKPYTTYGYHRDANHKPI